MNFYKLEEFCFFKLMIIIYKLQIKLYAIYSINILIFKKKLNFFIYCYQYKKTTIIIKYKLNIYFIFINEIRKFCHT